MRHLRYLNWIRLSRVPVLYNIMASEEESVIFSEVSLNDVPEYDIKNDIL